MLEPFKPKSDENLHRPNYIPQYSHKAVSCAAERAKLDRLDSYVCESLSM